MCPSSGQRTKQEECNTFLNADLAAGYRHNELAKLATAHSLLASSRKEPAKKMTEALLGADGLEVHRNKTYRVQQKLNRNDSVSFASDHQKLQHCIRIGAVH